MKHFEGEFVTYFGKDHEWKLYRAKDGTIIGYRSKHNKVGDDIDIERLVTNSQNPDDFHKFLERHVPKVKRYSAKDAGQLSITAEP